MSITLTPEQQECCDQAVAFLRRGQPNSLYRIGGYAGTGKTTVLTEICNSVPNLAICAYTGKASSVLREKGVSATTIHKQIYDWNDTLETFVRKKNNPASAFAIDEGSMVSKDIFDDLESFGKPILAVGDPGQLPPISRYDLNLMDNVDYLLQEVHRQALENPIVDFATTVRLDDFPEDYESETCNVYTDSVELFDDLLWADVILCGTNKTRVNLNNGIREELEYEHEIEEGEILICLKNDRKLGVFNGQMFQVTKIISEGRDSYYCILLDTSGAERKYRISNLSLGQEKSLSFDDTRHLFARQMIVDYGYAITVHKSQGSEWGRVAVYRERGPWEQRRWDYTAATRASEELRYYL